DARDVLDVAAAREARRGEAEQGGVVLELADDLAGVDADQALAVLDPHHAGAVFVAELDPDRDLDAIAAPVLAVLDLGVEVALFEVQVVGDVVALLVELALAVGGQ